MVMNQALQALDPMVFSLVITGVFGAAAVLLWFMRRDPKGVLKVSALNLMENMTGTMRKAKLHVNPEWSLQISRKQTLMLDESCEPYSIRTTGIYHKFPLYLLFNGIPVRLVRKQPIAVVKNEKGETQYNVEIEPLMNLEDMSRQGERKTMRAILSEGLGKQTLLFLILGLAFGVILGLFLSGYLPEPTGHVTTITQPITNGTVYPK